VARTRILIADDHEIFRRGVRSFLESRAEWEICGEASNGSEAIEAARKLKPDIVLMDIAMPHINGFDAAKQIRKELPETRILILTQYDSPQVLTVAAAAGAFGCITKSQVASDLLAAIDAAVGVPSSSRADQEPAAAENSPRDRSKKNPLARVLFR
jgi:DNA-binding NarL/FixJ family response regulator